MFVHARLTTPTCRKYRTFAPPLKFPSYATAKLADWDRSNGKYNANVWKTLVDGIMSSV